MQIKTILRILGTLLMVFSLSMLPPAFIADYYEVDVVFPFVLAFALTLVTGFSLWLLFRNEKKELKTRDGFIIVVLFWFVLSLFGALPLMIASHPHDTLTDAMFEAVSGFTTTGATVLSGLDHLPHAVRYYRQQMQFLGGMGIIVLAVAILPMLGIGGMQLYRAETPGPMKDSKLTPRITETAKALWYIYLGLTVLCAFSYWAAGMELFDAVGESFSTVATGGFSMHDKSFAFYNNPLIEAIAVVFMFLGGVNFSLHFLAVKRKSLKYYWRDQEFRAYLIILFTVVSLTVLTLTVYQTYSDPYVTVLKSVFNGVSLVTTTGLTSAPFASWPSFLPILLMFAACIGGCAASTSGGIKVMRMLLLQKQGMREVHRLVHPRSVTAIKFGEQVLPEYVLQAMWGFISVFVALFVIIVLALMATGLDVVTAFGATVATLANAGQGVGDLVGGFAHLSHPAKWILMLSMVAGRLEIFTLLVLFTPGFWRR